ncbi:cation-transporting P-type ATPase [bacterium]|nr:MAG: cation-transporting P-type ATPase [bacterium]
MDTETQGRSQRGLTTEEAARRLTTYGPNLVRPRQRATLLHIFFEEAREPMILLLAVTGVLYALWGKPGDTLTIFVVITALVGAEVFTEYRAKHAIEALSELSEPNALLLRDDVVQEVPTERVVPGDVTLLQAGRRVPADARLLASYGLAVEEAPLTGESFPVDKDPDDVVYAGTVVRRGRGSAVVFATGSATEVGRLAASAQETPMPRTPLQIAMAGLSGWLVWYAITVCAVVVLLGWLLTGESLRQMVLTGLSLAFAAIPEELPIIVTMVLGVGAYRLSQRHAIVKRLTAVEALGAVTVIATDKTGTLTENRMVLREGWPADHLREILEIGVLCNDADPRHPGSGDPLEAALLVAAAAHGIDTARLREENPLRTEFSFDNERKRMSTVHGSDGAVRVAAKGAPGAMLDACGTLRLDGATRPLSDADRSAIEARAATIAEQGLRVIALAERSEVAKPADERAAERDLTFVGLAAFSDPPRAEVPAAIAACRDAGIRVMMITGDHPLTAMAIARDIGLDARAPVVSGDQIDAMSDKQLAAAVRNTSVFARAMPHHKQRIIAALHAGGERVAMTGDGMNDAPALAAADIGIAMGQGGSDIARESAGLILADNDFATIVAAVAEGRVLYENLRKGVQYYLACKVALIAAILIPILLRVPVPFAPIQIIVMELFMDLAASATFVIEVPETDVMRLPPRDPRAPFMDAAMVRTVLWAGSGLCAAVTFAYLTTWYAGYGRATSETMAFVTWLIGHVLLAQNMRTQREPLVRVGLFSNPVMNAWAAATLSLTAAVTLVPVLAVSLRTTALDGTQWLHATGAALVGTGWIEAAKLFRQRDRRAQPGSSPPSPRAPRGRESQPLLPSRDHR